MITLYGFGPAHGLPDLSSFVIKAQVLLKLAEMPYELDFNGFAKAPKGKLPYIRDGEEIIADTTFIRAHLETRHGVDFDRGMDPVQKAIGYSFEKMCDEHLYWVVVHERWMDDENFNVGPRSFFNSVPAPVRPIVTSMVRRQVAKSLKGQGTGRHSAAEIASIGARTMTALSNFLGEKPYIMGDEPTGTDASVIGCVAGILCPAFTSPTLENGGTHENLIRYRDRMMRRFFPEFSAVA